MIRLLIKSGADRGLSIELKPGVNRLGRSPENDLTIDDPTISATHCEIELRDDTVLVRDLSSTNGTSIGGKRIQMGQLQPGQILRVGDVEMSLETAPVVIAIPEVNFAEPEPPPPLEDGSIVCLNHPTMRASHRCCQCHRHFCITCVHKLRLVGGQIHITCPVCSGRCELLPGQLGLKPKKSLFTLLRETLKIGRKRGG